MKENIGRGNKETENVKDREKGARKRNKNMAHGKKPSLFFLTNNNRRNSVVICFPFSPSCSVYIGLNGRRQRGEVSRSLSDSTHHASQNKHKEYGRMEKEEGDDNNTNETSRRNRIRHTKYGEKETTIDNNTDRMNVS